MSKYASKEFRVGDYWLSQRGNSPAWCRTWFNTATRQTQRVSLGTADFEQAKKALAEWFIQNHRPQNASLQTTTLADVLGAYYKAHGEKLRSAEMARIGGNIWLDFWADKSLAEVAKAAEQERFVEWLYGRGASKGYVSRILSVGRAAINRAYKRGEIERTIHVLDVSVGEVDPKGRPLAKEEVHGLLNACGDRQQHIRLFIVLMLGTLARPDAIRELTYEQIDFVNGLVHLNPKGRVQTKKYRPTVKLPDTLRGLLDPKGSGYVVKWAGEQVKSIKTAWREIRDKAGLDKSVNPYSLRHTMARHLRAAGVPPWEVAAQLGHKAAGYSITERYASHSPDYLQKAVQAIDEYLACVLRVSDAQKMVDVTGIEPVTPPMSRE